MDPTETILLAAKEDGRRARRSRSRQAVLEATRCFMRTGTWHPSARSIAMACGLSERNVFLIFPTLDELYAEALLDVPTALSVVTVVDAVSNVQQRAHLIVLGEYQAEAINRISTADY